MSLHFQCHNILQNGKMFCRLSNIIPLHSAISGVGWRGGTKGVGRRGWDEGGARFPQVEENEIQNQVIPIEIYHVIEARESLNPINTIVFRAPYD